jgi:two-component system response regulator ResD
MSRNSKGKVLVVEDDPRISKAVCKYLEKHGYSVFPVYKGRDALAYTSRVDLILLDLNLPDIDGLEVLQQVRQKSRLPVLIMSARAQGKQRVLGLELGADDYLTKPVLPEELLARVKALLRRANWAPDGQENTLAFDEKSRIVQKSGVQISLTQTELQLLRFLAESPDRAFTREELLLLVWREPGDQPTRRVDLTVSRIRVKFADHQIEPPIKSVWNVGYRFDGPTPLNQGVPG